MAFGFSKIFRFKKQRPVPKKAQPVNLPSTLHQRCSNRFCEYVNGPQVAAGRFNCRGTVAHRPCNGVYYVTPQQAIDATNNYLLSLPKQPWMNDKRRWKRLLEMRRTQLEREVVEQRQRVNNAPKPAFARHKLAREPALSMIVSLASKEDARSIMQDLEAHETYEKYLNGAKPIVAGLEQRIRKQSSYSRHMRLVVKARKAMRDAARLGTLQEEPAVHEKRVDNLNDRNCSRKVIYNLDANGAPLVATFGAPYHTQFGSKEEERLYREYRQRLDEEEEEEEQRRREKEEKRRTREYRQYNEERGHSYKDSSRSHTPSRNSRESRPSSFEKSKSLPDPQSRRHTPARHTYSYSEPTTYHPSSSHTVQQPSRQHRSSHQTRDSSQPHHYPAQNVHYIRPHAPVQYTANPPVPYHNVYNRAPVAPLVPRRPTADAPMHKPGLIAMYPIRGENWNIASRL